MIAIGRCRNFASLYDFINQHRLPGVGALTVYDTSLRIAAFLGVEPREVYLHAGPLKGARSLGVPRQLRRVPLADLPAPLSRLTAGEAEDFLCGFASRNKRGCGSGSRAKRPRC